MGWAFVFDSVPATPVGRIGKKPVPASDVPGEQARPTQPVPSRPPAFEQQGVSIDDAFDLTPELKVEAHAEFKKYRIGPIYTPPTLQGTLMRPGIMGGANWGGGAFNPEPGTLFVKTSNLPSLATLGEPAEGDADLVRVGPTSAEFHNGIPIFKPPYGHLTAIDLNKGEITWRVPFGDHPSLRAHPALKGVQLPEKLGA